MKVTDMPLFMLYVVIYVVRDPKNQVSVPYLRMRMRNKKFKVQTCASEVMANVFWDSVEMLLVVFLKRGATINSERFLQTLEVKATNSKDAGKQDDVSNQSGFLTLRLPSFWPLEGYTPRTTKR